MSHIKYLHAFTRGIGGGGTAIFVAELGPPPPINFFFKLDAVLGTEFAVPYLACFLRIFLGGLTMLSTYASLVDLTGRDLSIDCFILAVRVFNFASLSSKQRCLRETEICIMKTSNIPCMKLNEITLNTRSLIETYSPYTFHATFPFLPFV